MRSHKYASAERDRVPQGPHVLAARTDYCGRRRPGRVAHDQLEVRPYWARTLLTRRVAKLGENLEMFASTVVCSPTL